MANPDSLSQQGQNLVFFQIQKKFQFFRDLVLVRNQQQEISGIQRIDKNLELPGNILDANIGAAHFQVIQLGENVGQFGAEQVHVDTGRQIGRFLQFKTVPPPDPDQVGLRIPLVNLAEYRFKQVGFPFF